MKKIFFLMLITCAFTPLINAYEYLIFNYENATSGTKLIYYYDNDNILKIKRIESNGTETYSYTFMYNNLNGIKFNSQYYMKNLDFINIYKNDVNFLNDLYTTNSITLNSFLNYLYNDNRFSTTNYINYDNYELLYNSDGLVVESIVNDVWAGLYSDSEKGVSGRLYSSGGQLLYVNGKPINWMESQMIKLMDMVSSSIYEVVAVLGSMVPYIVAAVFVLLILYYVVSVGRRAIMHSNVKVRKRF